MTQNRNHIPEIRASVVKEEIVRRVEGLFALADQSEARLAQAPAGGPVDGLSPRRRVDSIASRSVGLRPFAPKIHLACSQRARFRDRLVPPRIEMVLSPVESANSPAWVEGSCQNQLWRGRNQLRRQNWLQSDGTKSTWSAAKSICEGSKSICGGSSLQGDRIESTWMGTESTLDTVKSIGGLK